VTLLGAAQRGTALTRYTFNVILQIKPYVGEVFMERHHKMPRVKSFINLLTKADDSVNVGDIILGSDQRVEKRMEIRYDFSVV
jgi:hypothetical protein